jgi:hypothetical protein
MVKVNLIKQVINTELELIFHINIQNVKIKMRNLLNNHKILLQEKIQLIVHLQK